MDNEPTNHKSGFLEENSNNRKDVQGNQNQVDNDQLHQNGVNFMARKESTRIIEKLHHEPIGKVDICWYSIYLKENMKD